MGEGGAAATLVEAGCVERAQSLWHKMNGGEVELNRSVHARYL